MDVSALFQPGLYKITCLKNQKVYIGQSENILGRLGRHTESLEKNRHDCQELQKDFNFYGKENFVFEALKNTEGADFTKLAIRKYFEQRLIQQTNSLLLYNKPPINSTQYFAQKVKIKGKLYSSLKKAAQSLKESRTNIFRKCLDPKNGDYELIETNLLEENLNLKLTQKYYFKAFLPCEINNQYYGSLNQASKALGIDRKTIKKRIQSPSYPNYRLLN
uniref:Putative GIY-YIG homing endonuclease n=1 Tax=Rhexinema sarcinoideum TaxID=43261 RepID=A0A1B2RYR5_9CHLO|nr:putative GIY-YIG homing endonuclease [Rhexinema sarcinoideum]